ncbi:hypothetical protein QFZ64_000483 [Streptomyces sp. B3I8]|nr:hypothetical protein [Streptomyces sp. B3I8]
MPGMIGSWPVRRSSPGHRTVGWSCSDGPVPHRVRRGVGGRRGAVGGRACASPRPAGGQVRALRAVGTPGGPVAGGAAEPGGRQPPVTGAGRARAVGGVCQWHHGCRPRQPRRRRPPSRAPGVGGPGTAMPWRARRPGRADLPELPPRPSGSGPSRPVAAAAAVATAEQLACLRASCAHGRGRRVLPQHGHRPHAACPGGPHPRRGTAHARPGAGLATRRRGRTDRPPAGSRARQRAGRRGEPRTPARTTGGRSLAPRRRKLRGDAGPLRPPGPRAVRPAMA